MKDSASASEQPKQAANMKRLTYEIFAFLIVFSYGCAAAPGPQIRAQQEARSFPQTGEEKTETQKDLVRLLAKLDTILMEFEQRTIENLDLEKESNPSIETEIRNRMDSQDRKLIELRAAQENLQSSLDAVMQREKVNSTKIEEFEQRFIIKENFFRRGNEDTGINTISDQVSVDLEKQEKALPILSESSGSLSPEEMYENARQAFGEQEYKTALLLWVELTNRFPDHKLAPSAYFWQGEACYQLQDFTNADLKFNEVVKKYQESNKYPAALLKQGMSRCALKRNDEGETLLKELIDKFPDRPEAKRAEIFLQTK